MASRGIIVRPGSWFEELGKGDTVKILKLVAKQNVTDRAGTKMRNKFNAAFFLGWQKLNYLLTLRHQLRFVITEQRN